MLWYCSVHAKLITMVLDYLYWAHCCGIGLFMLSSLPGYCVIHAVLVAAVSGYLSCTYPCDIWLYWLNQLLLLVGYSVVCSSIREENRPFSALQIRFTLMFAFGWLSVKPPGSESPPENLDTESLSGCTSSEDVLAPSRLPSLVPAPSLNWHLCSSVVEVTSCVALKSGQRAPIVFLSPASDLPLFCCSLASGLLQAILFLEISEHTI